MTWDVTQIRLQGGGLVGRGYAISVARAVLMGTVLWGERSAVALGRPLLYTQWKEPVLMAGTLGF